MRNSIIRLLTELEAKLGPFKDLTQEQVRELIYGFNKRVAEDCKKKLKEMGVKDE